MSFSMDGIVSIWVGQERVEPDSDFLREKFGVEYYDPDSQDCIVEESPTHSPHWWLAFPTLNRSGVLSLSKPSVLA